MTKFKLAFTSLLVVALTACCSAPAEKAAVGQLDEQHHKLSAKYTAYVEADPKLDAKAKNDELLLLKSIKSIIDSLKRSFGE